MEQLTAKPDRDRLELINTMLFTLYALNQSVHGWQEWIQNLDFMSKFSVTELQEMEAGLVSTVRTFLEYDRDVTKRHEHKIPQMSDGDRKPLDNDASTGIYV
jgi:hypothetical protein